MKLEASSLIENLRRALPAKTLALTLAAVAMLGLAPTMTFAQCVGLGGTTST